MKKSCVAKRTAKKDAPEVCCDDPKAVTFARLTRKRKSLVEPKGKKTVGAWDDKNYFD